MLRSPTRASLPLHVLDLLALWAPHSGVRGPIPDRGTTGSSPPVLYRPGAKVGTLGRVLSGEVVRFVDSREYFPRLLRHTPSILVVLLGVNDAPTEIRTGLEEEVLRLYWDEYRGWLVPTMLHDALGAVGEPCQMALTTRLELARSEILTPTIPLATALQRRIACRAGAVRAGVEGDLCPSCVALAGLTIDLLVFERACMADLIDARRARHLYESTGSAVERIGSVRELHMEHAVRYLLNRSTLEIDPALPCSVHGYLSEWCHILERPILPTTRPVRPPVS